MSEATFALRSFGELGNEPQARESSSFAHLTEVDLGLAWLLKLRWGAVAGQLVVLVFSRFALSIELPLAALLSLIGFTAATNVAFARFLQPHRTAWAVPTVLLLDIVILTSMIAVSGAAHNPFTVYFLVHVTLAALLLKRSQTWALVIASALAFALLFFVPAPHSMHHAHMHGHAAGWSPHLIGMWVAYVLAAGFVAHFVGQLAEALRQRHREIRVLADLRAQNERLATLSGFSANAAHELGTPLATIAIAARELSGALTNAASPELASDADLVCTEVARCRKILAELSARAGDTVGEMPVRTTAAEIVTELQSHLAPTMWDRLDVRFLQEADQRVSFVAPRHTLAQTLNNLIRNGFEAHDESAIDARVELVISDSVGVEFAVHDRGCGISVDTRTRLGEPFVSTKSERGGLGLGVYLARIYAERTHATLTFEAREGGGTCVSLRVASAVVERTAEAHDAHQRR